MAKREVTISIANVTDAILLERIFVYQDTDVIMNSQGHKSYSYYLSIPIALGSQDVYRDHDWSFYPNS